MDIKLKNHFIQGKEVKQPGDVIKIEKNKADKLIKKGYAVEVDGQTANEESQTSETTETADVDTTDSKTTKQKAKSKK